MASSVVCQYPTKTQLEVQNFDDENIETSEANYGKEECNVAPKDTSPTLPGWYADVSWPGTLSKDPSNSITSLIYLFVHNKFTKFLNFVNLKPENICTVDCVCTYADTSFSNFYNNIKNVGMIF